MSKLYADLASTISMESFTREIRDGATDDDFRTHPFNDDSIKETWIGPSKPIIRITHLYS